MKATVVVLALAVIGAVLGASSATAGPWGAGPGWGMGPGGAMWSNLTPDQQKQVTAMRLDFLKKQEALRGEIGRKKIEFAELANSPNADERLMEKKRQEIWNLQDKMRNERRAMGSNVWTLLTPDQRKQVGPYGPQMGMGFGRGRRCER